MSPKVGPSTQTTGTHLWMLLCALLSAVVLARGSSLSPEDLQSTAATSLPEDWNRTTIQLQPDLQTEAQVPTEAQTEAQTESLPTQSTTSNYTGLSCIPVLPPRRGSFYVESGTGVSIGSVLAFWCREGYQLVGSDKIYCNVRNGKPQWSNYLPVCEAIPRPEDRGLRVAVLASVVSGIVILAMSLSFLICCLQERSSRDRAKKEGRSRRREKRSARRSECWLEREEGDWEAFPPPKIFHLSQRMNPRLAPDSPLYLTGGLSGYENRGYQRSQESLLKASLPGLYRSESQLYPHVVLQRVPTPTAPSAPSAPSAPLYLHLPASSSSASSPVHATTHGQPHMMPQYPTPTYPPNPNTAVPPYPTPAPIYPNPNPTPQRPWQ
ncbi:sushi domain-containing protein 3 [Epinephelus fuscoguttatus]|uniref:sushi domain-containing protein 3 n=1 Tax=Epinephelus fuscoguttatus TaxID=293821 RepID=UPI0020D0B8F7|nr:sushi domain-containing protein 3 [Epinephelus fuscoguttatus]XP_049422622.1 sushi domain-containing protein 3 [Epinephelus fuscoguttatus]